MKRASKETSLHYLGALCFLIIDLCVTTLLHAPLTWCARAYLIGSILEHQAWLFPLFASMIVDQARALPVYTGLYILLLALSIRRLMEDYLNHTRHVRSIIGATILGITVLWGMGIPSSILGTVWELWVTFLAVLVAYAVIFLAM